MENHLITDVGFGDVKFLFDGLPQKFQTIIVQEPLSSAKIDFGEATTRSYEIAGVRYIAGDDAINAIKGGAPGGNIQRNTSWLVGRMPVLTQHAAYLAGVEDLSETSLTIGLPLGDFRTLESRVKRELSPIFKQVNVLSQGIGVLADHIEHNPTADSGTIVDIGFGTVIVLSYHDNKPTIAGTSQYDGKGLSEAAKRLSGRLRELTGASVSLPEANGYIIQGGGFFEYQGKKIDLTPLKHEELTVYSEEIISLLMSNHDTALARNNKIILAGGGAYHVEKYLREAFDGEVIVPISPEFANVRGYRYLAKLKESRS